MTIAKVNGDNISFGDYKSQLRQIQFDPKLVTQNEILALKKNILNEMIEKKIILQEAEKQKIKVSDEEVREMIQKTFSQQEIESIEENLKTMKISEKEWNNQIAEKILAEKLFNDVTKNVSPPSDQEVSDFYEKNMETFHQREKIHILQLMFSDKQQALDAQAKILGGVDFMALAQAQVNANDGGRVVGDLGFVERGILPEEVEKKVFSMKPGTISPIIESLPDYYLVKVLEKTSDKQLTLEEARQQIQSMLVQASRDKFYTTWLHQKTIESKIKRNDELLQENFTL